MKLLKLLSIGLCLIASRTLAGEALTWKNGDFSKELEGWKVVGPSGIKMKIAKGEFEGKSALELDVPLLLHGEDSWSVKISNEQEIELLANKIYNISFYMKAQPDRRADIQIKGNNSSGSAHGSIRVSADWQEYSVSITPNADCHGVSLVVGNIGISDSVLFLANVRISEQD